VLRFNTPFQKKKTVIALGAESCGVFCVYRKGKIFLSDDFGDLLDEANFRFFKKSVLEYLKQNKIKPDIVISDLHPLFKTTAMGNELARKFGAKFFQVQHHIAHIFSAYGEANFGKTDNFCGIAMDGTGYGLDGKIWGGEVFIISNFCVERIGNLENQIMIGNELAIKEPARMLISILEKFLDKEEVYKYVAQYYSRQEFEVLFNQLKQNFNCAETSSMARVLDAVSVLLGFSSNERKYKHQPIDLLEKNSSVIYKNIKPEIKNENGIYILRLAPLFKYLVKNTRADVKKDKKAAAAQAYLAKGLYKIVEDNFLAKNMEAPVYFGGGIANNKIISEYFESKGAVANKKIPRGDAGISFGQVIYYLSANSRN
jgi:hydrogenase maturation protein HypF